MFESVIKRINELQENFFSNVAEEKIATEKKSSIFGDNYGAEKNKNNPGSISGILQNNSEKDKKDKEIQKQINDAKQKKSENEQNIRTSEQTISKTDNSIKTTKSEIVSLNGQLSSLHEPQQSEFMKTTTNEDGKEIQVPDTAAYEAAHNAYLQQKEALEQQIAQKEQELQQLEEDLNTAKNELTTLKQEQASIDSEISSLEMEQQQASMEETSDDEQEDDKIQEEKAEEKAQEEAKEEEQTNIQNSANSTLFKIGQELSNSNIQFNNIGNIFSSDIDSMVSSVEEITNNLINNITEEEKDTDISQEADSSKESEIPTIIPKTTEGINSFFGNHINNITSLRDNITKRVSNITKEAANSLFERVTTLFDGNKQEMKKTFAEDGNAIKSEEHAKGAWGKMIGCIAASNIINDINKLMEKSLEEFINVVAERDAKAGIDRSNLTDEEKKKYQERDKAYEDLYLKYITKFFKDNGRKPTDEECRKLIEQAMEEIDKMNEEEQSEYNKTAEGMSNEEWERTTKNPGGVVNLIRAGKSAPEIIKIYRTPALFNNIDQVIELSNFGFSLDQITAIVNNPNYSNEMPNIFRLAETGRNLSEIMDLINNPNCRKSMAHVIKLAEMGISTSEITKIMNNSNCRMNLNQTVELVALGKNSNEINDLFNDPNCVGNLDIVINFAKMDIPAANIIGMLNDSNIKNAINGNDILAGINNNSNNINTPSDKNNIEDNFKEKETEKTENGDNKDNENFFNTYNSIISGMEFNNVKEKDVFKIISGDVSVNQINKSISGSSDNNMDIFELEFFKKRIQK
jgi:hypothetical protein